MACISANKTPEELRNMVKNREAWFDNQTLDDIISSFEVTDKVMSDPNAENLYEVLGVELSKRPSHATQKDFERKVKQWGGNISDYKTENNVTRRNLGLKMHAVQQSLIDALYNNKGTEEDAKSLAKQAPFAYNEGQFQMAKTAALRLIDQITKEQDQINKDLGTTGKAIIYTERKLMDPVSDMGGTIDVLAVFSDMSGAMYDYKSFHKKEFGESKIDTYRLPMAVYKDILLKVYNLKKIRQSRLLPIRTTLAYKPDAEQAPGDNISTKIQSITFYDTKENTRQIPVVNEETRFVGLNKLLEKQSSLIKNLEDTLQKRNTSKEEKDAIRTRVKKLRKIIRKTIVDLEIQGIRGDIINTLNYFKTIKELPEFLENGEKNPDAITIEKLSQIIDELSVYNELVENLTEYLKDFGTISQEKANEVYRSIKSVTGDVKSNIEVAKKMREDRIMDLLLDPSARDELGNLLSYEGMNGFERLFTQSNEFSHPIFRAFFKSKDSAEFDTRKDYKKFAENFEEVLGPLYTWAKANGYSRSKVFELFINQKTGNLYSKFSSDYFTRISKAKADDDVKFMKKYFEVNPKIEDIKEHIKERRDRYIASQKGRLNNLNATIDEETQEEITSAAENRREFNSLLKKWDQNNDIIKHNSAWLDTNTRRFVLRLKPELESEFYSEDYKRIKQTPELHNFYKFHTDAMYEFRDMLDIFGDVPANFLPIVRKSLAEMVQDSKGLIRPSKEIIEAMSVRTDDYYIKQKDPVTGEIQRQIPILFTIELENKDDKSTDLARNLFLFAKMAYSHKHLSEIEANVLALKELLGDPSMVQGGERISGPKGQRIKGEVIDFFDRAKRDTETYKLFSRFVDYFLYGVKFQTKEKDLFGAGTKLDSTKTLLNLKNYFAMKTLAFAVIPGTGAFIAGKIATIIEGKKGDSFTTKQFRESQVEQVKNNKMFRKLAKYFDTYSEDPGDRLATKFSTKRLNKIFASRNLFGPLRKADETLNDVVLNAMVRNYGINAKGEFIRLNRKGVNTIGAKSIKKIAKLDQNGELVLDLSKEHIMAFRNAVKNTMSNIIGNMSNEEVALSDLELGWSLAMQFKTWMPGLVRERIGKLRYDEHIQAVRQGRYGAYFSTYKPTKDELHNGFVLGAYIKEVLLPNMAKTAFDLATFGLAPKLGMTRVNEQRAKAHYKAWQIRNAEKNPGLVESVSFEEYLEAKQHQIKAFLVELRIILGSLGVFALLGADDDHGDPRYMNKYITRTLYKIFKKGHSELTFMWNPNEFTRLMKNPIPLTRLIIDLGRTIGNTFDEVTDEIFGEDSVQDKTPWGYMSFQWLYGGSQVIRLLEVYETAKNPGY